MKSLLILYPIQPYADVLMGKEESPEMKRKYALIYQRLISKRYPGFRRIWMMFSERQSPEKPDKSQLWNGISTGNNDIVGACGVDFAEHCEKSLYPDPKTIIAACPQPIEKLIIGGFHFWDCVEKAAKYAHEQGIDVTVDDDLTEFFFYKIRGPRGIPLVSRIPLSFKKSMERALKEYIKLGSPELLEDARKERNRKPWLAKI